MPQIAGLWNNDTYPINPPHYTHTQIGSMLDYST